MPFSTQTSFSKYTFNSSSLHHSVELLQLQTVNPAQIASWSRLAARALTPNPYYEPEFVLPLVAHLDVENVRLLVVADDHGEWQFVAPVISYFFEQGVPLPKLRALRSDYIFLDNPLVSNRDSTLILNTLFEALAKQRNWHGIGFAKTVASSVQNELMEFVATVSDVEVRHRKSQTRPCVTPQTQTDLLSHCSSSRRKTLRKGWKRLLKQGDVSFRLKQTAAEIPTAISDFLRLEALGWKGDQGTALSCESKHSEFFATMCEDFSKEERVLFGEITLNDEVIASTCNLLAGDTLYGFKIGWNPAYSDCSLGYWSEILLAEGVHENLKNVRMIDSCSNEDSYTGKVWQERIEIGSTVLIWSRRAKLMREAKEVVKKLVKN